MKRFAMTLIALSLVACSSFKKAEIKPVAAQKHSYGEIVSFQAGQALQFPDFTMTYLKEVDPEEGAEIQSTASIRERYFDIVENSGDKKQIIITHGQLPPRPYDLKLKSGQFVINTFTSSKGERLFDTKLEVVKK